jgi:hypothetical protein
MCPAGSGESVMGMVADAGGTIELTGTMSTRGAAARLEIPRGALAGPTVITITETDMPPPAGYVDGSPIYRIDPSDLMLAKPAVLTIPFAVLSGTVPPLAIYQIVGDTFVKVPDSYLNAGFLQGSIKTTGLYFAGAPKTPAQQNCP